MGLHAWTLNQILTPKFWRLVKRDGFMHTYVRNLKAFRGDQYSGGHEGPVQSVGMDEFGNRYFEDFSVDAKNNRRWIEWAKHGSILLTRMDKVPPAWAGWLSQTYNDVPSDEKNFVRPFYLKAWEANKKDSIYSHSPPGNINPYNPVNREEFYESVRARKYTTWEPAARNDLNLEWHNSMTLASACVADPSENY